MKTLVGFFFETGDSSCQYWEVWVIAESNGRIEYDKIHTIVNNEPFCDLCLDEDEEYEDIAERIMNESGYKWSFFSNPADNINNIFSFFL